MNSCATTSRACFFSPSLKTVGISALATAVAGAAAIAFKTAPLWVPFVAAAGPFVWAAVAVVGATLLCAVITLKIASSSQKKAIQFPDVKPLIWKWNGWDFDYKDFCAAHCKMKEQENSPQEQAALDKERLNIIGDQDQIVSSLTPAEQENYYLSKTQNFETAIRALFQQGVPRESCFVRQIANQFSKYTVDAEKKTTTLEAKFQVDHFDSTGKNRTLLERFVVEAKFNWSDGSIIIQDVRPLSFVEKILMLYCTRSET